METNPTTTELAAAIESGLDSGLSVIDDMQSEGYKLPVSESDVVEAQAAWKVYRQRYEALEDKAALLESDNAKLATALQQLEHAVNLSVGGQKVDVGEWLQLIQLANQALGDRSLSK